MQFKADALCLRAVDYKDKDKLLTLVSAQKGKFLGVARGVRAQSAKLKLAASPLCFGEYIIVSKGNIISGCQIYDNFFNTWEDEDKAKASFAILEVLDRVCPEGENVSQELLRGLKALHGICYTQVYPYAYLAWFLSGILNIIGVDFSDYNTDEELSQLKASLAAIPMEGVESLEANTYKINQILRLFARIFISFTALSYPVLQSAVSNLKFK